YAHTSNKHRDHNLRLNNFYYQHRHHNLVPTLKQQASDEKSALIQASDQMMRNYYPMSLELPQSVWSGDRRPSSRLTNTASMSDAHNLVWTTNNDRSNGPMVNWMLNGMMLGQSDSQGNADELPMLTAPLTSTLERTLSQNGNTPNVASQYNVNNDNNNNVPPVSPHNVHRHNHHHLNTISTMQPPQSYARQNYNQQTLTSSGYEYLTNDKTELNDTIISATAAQLNQRSINSDQNNQRAEQARDNESSNLDSHSTNNGEHSSAHLADTAQAATSSSASTATANVEGRHRHRIFNRILKKADWNALFVELSKVFLRYFLDLVLNDMLGKSVSPLTNHLIDGELNLKQKLQAHRSLLIGNWQLQSTDANGITTLMTFGKHRHTHTHANDQAHRDLKTHIYTHSHLRLSLCLLLRSSLS
ncbi:hypothetical protein GZH46_02144, partial [Fragariocoptes setiger]